MKKERDLVFLQMIHDNVSLVTSSLFHSYILMSKRTIEAYESAFQYIHDNLIPLIGDGIIIDYEKAMRRALIKVLASINSNMQVLGCWFHYCQALRRKLAKTSALFEEIRCDEKNKDIFRRFQCLPLLPLHHIESSFRSSSKEALKLDKNLFPSFIDYFNAEWMKIVTPYHFCVYKRDKRTTSVAEAFNGKVSKLFKTHGNFFYLSNHCKKLKHPAVLSCKTM